MSSPSTHSDLFSPQEEDRIGNPISLENMDPAHWQYSTPMEAIKENRRAVSMKRRQLFPGTIPPPPLKKHRAIASCAPIDQIVVPDIPGPEDLDLKDNHNDMFDDNTHQQENAPLPRLSLLPRRRGKSHRSVLRDNSLRDNSLFPALSLPLMPASAFQAPRRR